MSLWVRIYFTSTFSFTIIIPHSPKVLEGILDYDLIIRSTVRLEAADYVYSIIFVKAIEKPGIHETSYC